MLIARLNTLYYMIRKCPLLIFQTLKDYHTEHETKVMVKAILIGYNIIVESLPPEKF